MRDTLGVCTLRVRKIDSTYESELAIIDLWR